MIISEQNSICDLILAINSCHLFTFAKKLTDVSSVHLFQNRPSKHGLFKFLEQDQNQKQTKLVVCERN